MNAIDAQAWFTACHHAQIVQEVCARLAADGAVEELRRVAKFSAQELDVLVYLEERA